MTLGKRTTAAAFIAAAILLLPGRFMAAARIAGPRSIDLITPARIGMAGTTPTTDTATRSPSRLDSGAVGIRTTGTRITAIRTATPTTTAHRYVCT